MRALQRLREVREHHGSAYARKRLLQKADELLLGSYERRRRREQPDPAELRSQREHQPEAGLISVVTPVYNTDPGMLSALLDSLENQTYRNFEAVLYDGNSTRAETLAVLEAREKREPRFRVIRGGENLGISGNTNAALRYVRGAYVALCDHDDLLTPDALWRMAKRIAAAGPDLLYSDEDRITQGGRRHMDPHYKPDYGPDTLTGDNYFCHLSVIRKTLLEAVGGLRPGFDGSQDHDLFLRLSERTDRIEHIPHVLYSWREVFSSKSHTQLQICLENSCRAAAEHMTALGYPAQAAPVNQAVRLWIDIPAGASVEALIHGTDEQECRACLAELQFRTGWPRLSGSVIAAPAAERWSLLNQAARTSEADYLLVLEAGVTEMNRYFMREMLMYAQRPDVGGVSGILTDRKGRVTHAGFALGLEGAARCVNEGLGADSGGFHNLLNKVRNVSAVSLCCLLVRRDRWLDADEGFRGGLAAADLGLRQREAGLKLVLTPHARAVLERGPLLLSGGERDPEDLRRFEEKWGPDVYDPCYSPRFSRKTADFRY